MQTSKPKNLEAPLRKPRPTRQLKASGSDSVSASGSPLPPSKMTKERSPRPVVTKSVQSSVLEKKRPNRVSTMESQIAQLQDELKKAKDQLNSAELGRRRAKEEAEEGRQQLEAMSLELEESRQQLLELSASEDERIQELRKISQDRDRAWQSELEALQKQHLMDSAALGAAMNENQKLKLQLERIAGMEVNHSRHAESAQAEIHSLRIELKETLSLVEELKSKLCEYEDSEAQSLEDQKKTQMELETANETIETLRSEGTNAMKAFSSVSLELEQSKEKVASLEALVSKYQVDLAEIDKKHLEDQSENKNSEKDEEETEYINQLKTELNCVRSEMGQLKLALDAADRRYQDEYLRSTIQIRSSYEELESVRSESRLREAAFEAELVRAKAQIEQLRTDLEDKEAQLLSIAKEKETSNMNQRSKESERESDDNTEQLKKLEADIEELKASLLDKETELQGIIEENDMLRVDIQKMETGRKMANGETTDLEEPANEETLNKLGSVNENSEMEAELRRLRVQLEQWRKAAEAAAAMLSPGKDGKLVDISGPIDSNYPHGSLYSEELDDDSPKKKNINMLKKIGVLWKKNQK
ncbi:interactor of constitutive active ROPs 2, chloroplastic-like [Cucurbita pepo subsp. pepo]|uniref:interactor of constitutive active ROPs 2, chloroplastic-like n=1 Tax=Cucurbita pepo subsp. pepo TaxID=3664 RepID=UPI000C9D3F5C|nr:interactor of constitutive active ROPs 2, chloroplastic-like [Cucurbita pepo subsp. pepo]XP_023544326.1 interactor of constitutive active ROPs 2, chloroplastic-like [Cucurbita pepo subsp. pepo]XP_023544327.1 interactor of constitutive active ROPs 2, chloroplastic-like [Cucurbita pepo subsp. pepo]XP_023544328.1 interactor of constitutive active ROPs 2, chloroplastic-like [Cucurbita pepo subsp. pepo]